MKSSKHATFIDMEHTHEQFKSSESENKFGYFYQEASAKTGDNVKRAFKTMATRVVEDFEWTK